MENTFLNVFHLVCILSTVGIASWCCYKYSLNRDVSVIEFIKFNSDEESPYPSFSLCFMYPCLDQKIRNSEPDLSCNDYYGMHKNDSMINENLLKMNYDNFTINLNDYLLGTKILLENESSIEYNVHEHGSTSNILRPPYRSFTDPRNKCYTFITPLLKETLFSQYSIYLNKTFFPNLNHAGFAIHYQNQINQGNVAWKMVENSLSLDKKLENGIDINLSKISRLNRRNKPHSPCNGEWEEDDLLMLEETAKNLGCRHPHLNISLHLPTCSKGSEIKNFTWNSLVRNFNPPCISIIDSSFELIWDPETLQDDSVFSISVLFLTTTFQETIQVISICLLNQKYASLAINTASLVRVRILLFIILCNRFGLIVQKRW